MRLRRQLSSGKEGVFSACATTLGGRRVIACGCVDGWIEVKSETEFIRCFQTPAPHRHPIDGVSFVKLRSSSQECDALIAHNRRGFLCGWWLDAVDDAAFPLHEYSAASFASFLPLEDARGICRFILTPSGDKLCLLNLETSQRDVSIRSALIDCQSKKEGTALLMSLNLFAAETIPQYTVLALFESHVSILKIHSLDQVTVQKLALPPMSSSPVASCLCRNRIVLAYSAGELLALRYDSEQATPILRTRISALLGIAAVPESTNKFHCINDVRCVDAGRAFIASLWNGLAVELSAADFALLDLTNLPSASSVVLCNDDAVVITADPTDDSISIFERVRPKDCSARTQALLRSGREDEGRARAIAGVSSLRQT